MIIMCRMHAFLVVPRSMGSLYSLLREARQGNMRVRDRLTWGRRLTMLQVCMPHMHTHTRRH
jgi:hypothetical protein